MQLFLMKTKLGVIFVHSLKLINRRWDRFIMFHFVRTESKWCRERIFFGIIYHSVIAKFPLQNGKKIELLIFTHFYLLFSIGYENHLRIHDFLQLLHQEFQDIYRYVVENTLHFQ